MRRCDKQTGVLEILDFASIRYQSLTLDGESLLWTDADLRNEC